MAYGNIKNPTEWCSIHNPSPMSHFLCRRPWTASARAVYTPRAWHLAILNPHTHLGLVLENDHETGARQRHAYTRFRGHCATCSHHGWSSHTWYSAYICCHIHSFMHIGNIGQSHPSVNTKTDTPRTLRTHNHITVGSRNELSRKKLDYIHVWCQLMRVPRRIVNPWIWSVPDAHTGENKPFNEWS